MSSLASRFTPGVFGLGWATSWQTSLSVDGAGNVTINSGGEASYFSIQANGSYLDTAGEHGPLTQSGGIYTFTDVSGDQSVFLPNGLLNYEQDTSGNQITLSYNSQNQLITLTYSNPSDPSEPSEQLSLTYNVQGFVSQEADGTGNIWTYTYDAAGHLLSVKAPGPTSAGLTTSYTYDTGNNLETVNALLSITNPDGSQQNFTYDSVGRLSGTSASSGALPTSYTYLGEGEIGSTDSAGDQSIVWYNELGLPSRAQDPRGGISTYLYDSNGNLISATDAAGNTGQYTYDQNGNLTKTVNPLGQTVERTYNSLRELTSITDAGNNSTQYNYAPNGNLLSITYPDGTQQSFTYDPLGNLTETIEQDGNPISNQYNAQGLTTQASFADGTSETYAYDAHGNLLKAKTFGASGDLTDTTTLTYDDANQLTSITYPNGQGLTFMYNAQGQRIQSVDQSGYTLTYSYDSLGRLSGLSDGTRMVVTYIYNSLGRLSEKQNGNGTYTTYAYDAAGNLKSESNFAPGGQVNSSFAYTYNVLDEITSVTDAAGNVTTYGYDALGQLTQVTLPGGQGITYVYDAAGNRTEVINNGTTASYASNSDNQITQAGATAYIYDANGNLLTATDASGTTTYSYNDQNRLVSINASDGTATTFQYSSLGFMTGMNVNGTQTNFLVDPTGLGNVVASYNGSGSLIAHYQYGLGLVSQTGPNAIGYYDFDVSGNTIGITGGGGTYVNRYSYLPFGETTTIAAALPNPFTFVGLLGVMQIGSNLFSMRARDYTPATGQFTSNDPLGLAAGDTNIRRYVGNGPTNNIDPIGLGYFGLRPLDSLKPFMTNSDALGTFNINVAHQQYFFDDGTSVGGTTYIQDYHNPVDQLGGEWSQYPAERSSEYTLDTTVYYDDAIIQQAVNELRVQGDYSLPFNNCQDWATRIKARYWEIVNEKIAHGVIQTKKLPTIRIFHLFTTNEKSNDPNALIGPAGYGTPSFIQPTGTLPYTIDFENDGSVAALDVTVTEQLDPNLDWSTFQLGSFGFGPVNVTIPAGLTEYETTVSYQNTDGSSLNVQVSLDFNVATGLLTVTYASLDPLTGQAPTGVFDGFLYPESESLVGSEGYVQYTVGSKATLATGATINQQASIVFDTNAPLATNMATNTIDASTPTSSVTALPANSLPVFAVSWTGQDAGGSGIASYDVYVSDNGGPFTLWQSDTSATSAIYTGQAGQTYGFYSVATDNVGLVEPAPTCAQATTYLASPPTSAVNSLPAATASTSFTVSWGGSAGPGASNIASYEIFVSDDGGPFTPFLTHTTLTSATFSGQFGHTYGFYSVATDSLGQVQATPQTAQAMTTVVSQPAPPMIIGEHAVFQRKTNKKGKPVGSSVLAGFDIDFSAPLNPASANNPAHYQLGTITTKKVKKKKVVTTLHPITKFTVSYGATTDSVDLALLGTQKFPTGGRLTIVGGPSGGVTGASGAPLGGITVLAISAKGRTITP